MSKKPSILTELPVGEAYKKAQTMGADGVIEELIESQLRGRGGAGFPTGLKWKFTKNAKGDKKYVVCNADEGELGTFKDQKLLTEYIDKLLEGMAIASFVIGAEKAFLYLRWEYSFMKENIEAAIEKANKMYDVEIILRFGAGAYVCGEESALIDSLEGKRGEPRNKPPFPVSNGLYDAPTIINNVETLCCIPHIILEGAEFFKSVGTEKSKGPKLFSISGDVNKPGVYEFAMGVSLKRVLKVVGAERPKAAIIGGAGGRITCAQNCLQRRLAFEDLPPGGSIIIINEDRDLLGVMENIMDFFAEESCGQCVPCREGTKRMRSFIQLLRKRTPISRKKLDRYKELGETMQLASKCGLGQSAPNLFLSLLEYFEDELVVLEN